MGHPVRLLTKAAVRTSRQPETAGADPKLTALYFRYEGKVVHRVERQFGAGSIALLASCYPMSNEALAGERDTRTIAWALGENHKILFDERHLGIEESGGVVTLARKYHLEVLGVALLVLLGLFISEKFRQFSSHSNRDRRRGRQHRGDGLEFRPGESPAAQYPRGGADENLPRRMGGIATMAPRFYSEAKIRRVRDLAGRRTWRCSGDVPQNIADLSRAE